MTNASISTGTHKQRCSVTALFSYGFRPFFLAAAFFAGIGIPLWLAVISGDVRLSFGDMDPVYWHSHEMLLGYLEAVIAGFLLTAIPNWTGRQPIAGFPLAALFLLWFAGRAGMTFAVAGLLPADLAKAIDCSFPIVLTAVLGREIALAGNWRNAPVIVLLALIAAANIALNFSAELEIDRSIATKAILGTVSVLICLVGGRITPNFTRNWLAARGARHLPAPFGTVDKLALAVTVLAALSWIAMPISEISGVALLAAGLLNALRLSRWRGLSTMSEPLLAILHMGYGWLCLALLLLGLQIQHPETIPQSAGIHALTAGAIGVMTLAVMTRASFGHTGKPLASTPAVTVIFMLVNTGAALRVLAPWIVERQLTVLIAAGILWAGAYVLFLLAFWPLLCRPRSPH